MINSDIAELIRDPVIRTREILEEVKRIRMKPFLTEDDEKQLALLRVDLMGLCPPIRFSWRNAAPCVDLWAELITLNEGVQG
ncbi:MAG TPA: hypothetical protein PLO63_11705 [Syntrophales bacterium]|nr:hypothetical protein [Syntrophales bacterium]